MTAADRSWRVTVSSGTNLAVAVAPGTRRLAVTLQGAVWLVPAAGGIAEPLTPPGYECAEAHRPSWSPDGRWLAFQTNRDGHFHLWRVDVDGRQPVPLTWGGQDDREPAVAPDGQRVAFASDRTGRYEIWVLDLRAGTVAKWSDDAGEAGMPSWSPDGGSLAYVLDGNTIRVQGEQGAHTLLHDPGRRLYGPVLAPDGARLACVALDERSAALLVVTDGVAVPVTNGEDVFPFAPHWLSDDELVYSGDGLMHRRDLRTSSSTDIPFQATIEGRSSGLGDGDGAPAPVGVVRGIVDPALAPDGGRVAFHALGAVWTATLGERPHRLDATLAFQTGPSWCPDGESLVYSSDLAGSPDLWRYDLRAGRATRLTALPGAQTSPAVSPVGGRIAFQDHDDRTFVLDTATLRVREVLPALMQPSRPGWAPSGDMLALLAHVPASRRFREGSNQLLVVDVGAGTVRYTSFEAYGTVSGRASGAPAWSPDGTRLALVMDGLLHVVPVSPAGDVVGAPMALTDHTADSPSWSPDSRSLVYLHHGRLRRVDADGTRPDDVPLDLRRAQVAAPARRELHVGALWDGRADHVVRDVRILVEGGRIARIEPGVPRRPDETTFAADVTAMPGLVDMHTHAAGMLAATYGRRLGLLHLTFGITTLRSTGDPAYVAAAAREASEHGELPGPRFVPTGELLDGARSFWSMARPVTSEDQLLREIERCHRLGMRFVKIYNRLPTAWHERVVDEAHRRGMRVTSHHLYPGVVAGQDGLEHLVVATNRVTTLVSRLGHSHADVLDLISASRLALTPTLFDASVHYHDDDSMLYDERVRRLYPPWAYERLRAKLTAVRAADPGPARMRLDRIVESIRRIMDAGGLVTTGTDAPLDDVSLALHQNLRALVRGGLRPVDALRTATANAAASLGCEHELGTLGVGTRADIALVRGDPLADIAVAADVEAVLVGGHLHRTVDLLVASQAADDADIPPAYPELVVDEYVHDPDDPHWWHDPSSWDSGAPAAGSRSAKR